ncbi:hypothetical protein KUTeg_018809 [Tegillarca granosa]|uniref:DNA replication complex GINS protein PSF3 n=1 Tax=Tegillarca granosa TaxID=220873 RepID=A0ABQ9EGN2_TEGGR|nr:hypothetical protein KUTeg_018809 [Tegillarca granosa]
MTTDIDNYFSISDILATQERIPCKIELPIHRLGYLDTSSESEDLLPGTKMEMPYWMAKALCSRKRHIVSVEQPKQYRESYREILNADATAYQARLRKIMDLSQNCYNEDTSKLTEKLDEVERYLFKSGQKGLNDFQRWETRQIEKLTTSDMVRNHRKRKRATDDA